MRPKTAHRSAIAIWVIAAALAATAAPAWAGAAGGFPWETPLQTFLDSITGPIAKALAILGIIIAGALIVLGNGIGGIRKLVFACLGISVIFAASSFFLGFLGWTGGVEF